MKTAYKAIIIAVIAIAVIMCVLGTVILKMFKADKPDDGRHGVFIEIQNGTDETFSGISIRYLAEGVKNGSEGETFDDGFKNGESYAFYINPEEKVNNSFRLSVELFAAKESGEDYTYIGSIYVPEAVIDDTYVMTITGSDGAYEIVSEFRAEG